MCQWRAAEKIPSDRRLSQCAVKNIEVHVQRMFESVHKFESKTLFSVPNENVLYDCTLLQHRMSYRCEDGTSVASEKITTTGMSTSS